MSYFCPSFAFIFPIFPLVCKLHPLQSLGLLLLSVLFALWNNSWERPKKEEFKEAQSKKGWRILREEKRSEQELDFCFFPICDYLCLKRLSLLDLPSPSFFPFQGHLKEIRTKLQKRWDSRQGKHFEKGTKVDQWGSLQIWVIKSMNQSMNGTIWRRSMLYTHIKRPREQPLTPNSSISLHTFNFSFKISKPGKQRWDYNNSILSLARFRNFSQLSEFRQTKHVAKCLIFSQ